MTPLSPVVSIGVLDVDGLHLADRPLIPIRGAIRHVGDIYNGAEARVDATVADRRLGARGRVARRARRSGAVPRAAPCVRVGRPGRPARLPHGAHALAGPT